MEQEIQPQPQQLNPIPPNNKNKIIIVVASLFVITILVIVGYFVFSQSSVKPAGIETQQKTDVSSWKLYKNNKYNFEIKYPEGWFISESSIDGPWRLQSADPIDNSHGIGLPAVGNMWVDISSSVCHNPNNDNFTGFVAESKPDILEASECQDNFYITLGLWQADQNLIKNKDILNQILSTFKFTGLETVSTGVSSLKTDSFEWCIANGGDDRTPSYNAPKVCVLNNKVYEESCVGNTKYFVIESNLTDSVGANHLVKSKTDANQNFVCEYKVEKGDFEIKNEWAEYTLALENNFLILDSGTGPDPRGLIIYDLNLRKKVYEDSYSQPVNIQNNTIDYWTGTTKPVTEQNCPEFKKWEEGGLGSAIDAHVSLNLLTLVKKELGEYRCSPRQ